MQILYHLGDIAAEAVFASLIRIRREQRHHVDVDGPASDADVEAQIAARRTRRLYDGFVFVPFACERLRQLCRRVLFSASVGDDGVKRAAVTVTAAGVYGNSVFAALGHVDVVVIARIRDAAYLVGIVRHARVVRVLLVQIRAVRRPVDYIERDERLSRPALLPAERSKIAVLKRAVEHHLGVKSAVDGVVDILEEYAEQIVGDVVAAVARDGERHPVKFARRRRIFPARHRRAGRILPAVRADGRARRVGARGICAARIVRAALRAARR